MQIIENNKIKEKMYIDKLENGLTVIVVPKKNIQKKYIVWGVNFGSVDNRFKVNKDEIYVIELSLTKLCNKKIKPIKFKESSKYPSIVKDVAFVVNKDITNKEITDVIKKAGGKLLDSIEVFDIYTGDNVGKDEKSIAYSLTFKDDTRTLNEDEVMQVFNKIIKAVEDIGAELRDK